ncbi:hypothetical protein GQX74_007698 [Glossina fuscipes]|nr:hypothetical protein GQX74_007698 [Glossina fuscipes]
MSEISTSLELLKCEQITIFSLVNIPESDDKHLPECRTEISINSTTNFEDYGSLALHGMKFWLIALAIIGVTISVNKVYGAIDRTQIY